MGRHVVRVVAAVVLTAATGLALLSCNRPFGVRLTPVAKRVAGCLAGGPGT